MSDKIGATRMENMEEDEDYREGKNRGEIQRAIDELGGEHIASGKELLKKARNLPKPYNSYYRQYQEKFILGYLVGYTRSRLVFFSSSLTYEEIKDIPPTFLINYDELS